MFDMKLYRLTTAIGEYYAVAEHPTQAEENLQKMLDFANYGYSSSRKVTQITLLAEAPTDPQFLSGKYLVL